MSLVEIMIVILLIGIVSAGAAVLMGRNTDQAKFARAEKDLEAIATAFTQYYNVEAGFDGITTGDLHNCGIQNKLANYFTRDIATLKDPWDNFYQVNSTYNSTTGMGVIVVYVQKTDKVPNPESGANSGSLNGVSGIAINRYANNSVMGRTVYNIQ